MDKEGGTESMEIEEEAEVDLVEVSQLFKFRGYYFILKYILKLSNICIYKEGNAKIIKVQNSIKYVKNVNILN